MKFDIARQPLVPAFLTLAALMVVAMWSAGGLGISTAVPEGNTAGFAAAGQSTSELLAISLPSQWLAQFQATHPIWACWIAGFLMLFTGMSIGRLTIRYNLYTVGTCLAIPLYGAIVCAIAEGNSLTIFMASALLILAIKNFCRSFCNGFGFDAIFRASLYLGLLPLLIVASIPLFLLLPLCVLLFRRTLREVAVATAGLLLPILTISYINWGAGGDILAPICALGSAFVSGTPLSLFHTMPAHNYVLLGAVSILNLMALLFFLSDIYAVGTKARFVFIFITSAFLLSAVALCGPAATPETIALTAVPSAILLPFMFVRIHRAIALPLYFLLLFAASCKILLQ